MRGSPPRSRAGSRGHPYLLAHFVVQLSDALVGPVLPEGGQNVAEGIRSEKDGSETSDVERASRKGHDVPSNSAHRKCLQKTLPTGPATHSLDRKPKTKASEREGSGGDALIHGRHLPSDRVSSPRLAPSKRGGRSEHVHTRSGSRRPRRQRPARPNAGCWVQGLRARWAAPPEQHEPPPVPQKATEGQPQARGPTTEVRTPPRPRAGRTHLVIVPSMSEMMTLSSQFHK